MLCPFFCNIKYFFCNKFVERLFFNIYKSEQHFKIKLLKWTINYTFTPIIYLSRHLSTLGTRKIRQVKAQVLYLSIILEIIVQIIIF